MAVQQGKKSKAKIRSRKAANRFRTGKPTTCPACGAARLSHRVCPSCGNYDGRQVISVTAE